MKSGDDCFLKNLDSVLKSRDITLLTKVCIVKAIYDLPRGHVLLWELDHKEGRMLRNLCFWTVVLERLLKVPWRARRSNQLIFREMNPEYSLEGLMLKLKLQYFGHLMRVDDWRPIGKVPDAGKDQGQKEKRPSEDEMAGWHHQCNEHELGQTLVDSEGQGGLVCCCSWGCKGSDMTGQLKNTNKALVLKLYP